MLVYNKISFEYEIKYLDDLDMFCEMNPVNVKHLNTD